MKQKTPLLSSQFVDSVFTPLSLVLISIVAIIAVAVALFQVNKGPVAPTAPQSNPRAADIGSTDPNHPCALAFVVPGPTDTPGPSATPSETPTLTLTPTATLTPTPSSTPAPTDADLELHKTASAVSPVVGSQITYTITVKNDGPHVATGVTVSDHLPTNLQYVSSTPAGQYDPNTGIWTIPGTINVGETVTLQITATVTSSAQTVNYAQVETSDQPDNDSTPGDDSTNQDDDDSVLITPVDPSPTPVVVGPTATPNPIADLSLTKQVSNSTPKVGEQVTYTVVVYNAGPATATNVTVYEPLVGGTSYLRYRAEQGTYDVNTGIWTIGTIPANSSKKLEIDVTINVEGAITNTAQVQHSDQPDNDSTPGNNNPNEDDQQSATTNPTLQGADLSLLKRVNNSTPVVGQNVTFTIEVHNAGPQQADNVSVQDLIPQGTTYVLAEPSQGSFNSGNGVWTVGSLTKDTTATLLLTVKVNSGSTIVNTAEVISSSQPDGDSTPNNHNPNEDDQDDSVIYPQGAAALPKAGNASSTTLFVIATGVIVLIIGAMGLLLLL